MFAPSLYWDYWRLSLGVRAERLRANEELFWAWEYVEDLVLRDPLEAVGVITALAAQAPSDEALAFLGAGPLEELLRIDDAAVQELLVAAMASCPELELPRTEQRLPKPALTITEAEAVLAVPDLTSPVGLRDRAMLEVLYSTGMRRAELAGLRLHDIDPERRTVLIRQGKGRKDRMIPIGQRALDWIDRYTATVTALVVMPR